jgi:hypothetical protein
MHTWPLEPMWCSVFEIQQTDSTPVIARNHSWKSLK